MIIYSNNMDKANNQSPHIWTYLTEHKKTTTCDVGNPVRRWLGADTHMWRDETVHG